MDKIKYDKVQVESVFSAYKDEDAILITSDGNVFLEKHESYAKTHCREFRGTYERLTRTEFEAGEKGGKSKTPAVSGSGSNTPTSDWRILKFGEIVDFAKSKGLTPVTLKNKGTNALIAEVETFLASFPKVEEGDGVEKTEVKNLADDDYNPVGTGTDSNPQA